MSEQTETREVEKPSWLELPEVKPLILWACLGEEEDVPDSIPASESCRTLFESKEEAEAWAYANDGRFGWLWDREPAQPTSLVEAMAEVRRDGESGVHVKGYRNGEWVTLKEYPAGRPLMGEDQ